MLPRTAAAQFGGLEADTRVVPWSSLTRFALEAGAFTPGYRPVTESELAQMLAVAAARSASGQAPALAVESESRRLARLLTRYRDGGDGYIWHGCPCKVHPPHLRLSGRVIGGFSGLGNPIMGEGGLGFVSGHNVYVEPRAELAWGRFWAAVQFRIGGRVAPGGHDFLKQGQDTAPLTWPGWSRPTGRADVRDWRLRGGAWRGEFTRALLGARFGRWALSLGWDQRRTGTGLTGDLNLSDQGRPFAAFTARRTRPFRWSGVLEHLAPDEMLLRAGRLSGRTVQYHDVYGNYEKSARPWFFQWLLGWNVTPWFRTHFTQSVVATAREGTLWPDLLQINFPLVGTTWREGESGPITDRIFAAQFEIRWRDAPWPLLPADGGRIYWDYGGTDFLPSGPYGLLPQISVPASLVGCELVSPGWDLGFEYAELQHKTVLWYSNGGYPDGYSQEQTLIGHPFGGSAEAVTGLLRGRPSFWETEWELRARRLRWGMRGRTPGTGEMRTVALVLRCERQGLKAPSWEVSAEWNREQADPTAFAMIGDPVSAVSRDWWRLVFKVGI